jgi:hypothetical protein
VLDVYIEVFRNPETPTSQYWFDKMTAMRKQLINGGPIPTDLEPIEPK